VRAAGVADHHRLRSGNADNRHDHHGFAGHLRTARTEDLQRVQSRSPASASASTSVGSAPPPSPTSQQPQHRPPPRPERPSKRQRRRAKKAKEEKEKKEKKKEEKEEEVRKEKEKEEKTKKRKKTKTAKKKKEKEKEVRKEKEKEVRKEKEEKKKKEKEKKKKKKKEKKRKEKRKEKKKTRSKDSAHPARGIRGCTSQHVSLSLSLTLLMCYVVTGACTRVCDHAVAERLTSSTVHVERARLQIRHDPRLSDSQFRAAGTRACGPGISERPGTSRTTGFDSCAQGSGSTRSGRTPSSSRSSGQSMAVQPAPFTFTLADPKCPKATPSEGSLYHGPVVRRL
jgi:hypothetical protein